MSPSNSNTTSVTEEKPDILEKHLGLIHKMCFRAWMGLPPNVRAHYDLDDMINDAAMRVWHNRHKYNPGRGAQSTFVGQIVSRYCITIYHSFTTQSRTGICVRMEDLLSSQVPGTESDVLLCEAVSAIERLLEFGSDDVQQLLSELLAGAIYTPRSGRDRAFRRAALHEIRELVRRHSVRRSDFDAVLTYAVTPA